MMVGYTFVHHTLNSNSMILEGSIMRKAAWLILTLGMAAAQTAGASDYPYPVERFTFDSQQQELSMAYMDVKPTGESSKGVVVLLHGKNFNGAYWEQTIDFLKDRGHRVVVPDQVGFGRSSMPKRYQFTFDQLAANTQALLEQLDVEEATVMGHSMGGMLATQFALQYLEVTDHLVLLNPIGLEDWRGMGDYTELGRRAAERIPRATLVEFEDVGHLPHIEAPEQYLEALANALSFAEDPNNDS